MTSCSSNICDKTINIKHKSKRIKYRSHKHKKNYTIVVKDYEFITPDINKMDYISNNCFTDCFYIYFHRFKFRCIYNIEMTNGDSVNGKVSDKKLKELVRKNVFIHKLSKKNFRSLSNESI